MKRFSALVLAGLLAMGAGGGSALLLTTSTGCAVFQPSAYKTLNILATSVDAGMKAFADAVVAGKVNMATQLKVEAMHGRYRPALQAAVTAARFDTSQPAPEALKALAADLLKLITEATR